MRVFAFLVMVFGIVLAVGAIHYADKFMAEQANAARATPTTVRILVANQRLSQGDILADKHLTWVDWPATSVPEGAFASTKALFGNDHTDRRYVTRTIEPGEPITDGRISEPNKAGGIKDLLPAGYRAVSIRVDDVTSVAGFVVVGDRVDVLLTHSPNDILISSVLLQDVEVLAVDQSIDSERNNPQVARTVTILVTMREAQLISLALQRGKLSLVLRNQGTVAEGDKAAPVRAEELNDLIKTVEDPGNSVRVRRGTSDMETVPVK